MSCIFEDCSFFLSYVHVGPICKSCYLKRSVFPSHFVLCGCYGTRLPKVRGIFSGEDFEADETESVASRVTLESGLDEPSKPTAAICVPLLLLESRLVVQRFLFNRNKGFNNFMCHIRLIIMYSIHLDFWSFVNIWWYLNVISLTRTNDWETFYELVFLQWKWLLVAEDLPHW